MKAIRVSVSFHEWSKFEEFLCEFKHDDDTFIYQVDNITFVAVCVDEDAMDWFKARLLTDFEDEPIIVELR